jgi:hypothetical protein
MKGDRLWELHNEEDFWVCLGRSNQRGKWSRNGPLERIPLMLSGFAGAGKVSTSSCTGTLNPLRSTLRVARETKNPREGLGMGVTYSVISSGEVSRHAFAVECLQYYDMLPPSAPEPSRNPSPQELRSVLDDLPGYTTDYVVSPDNWQASVEATTGWRLLRSETLVSVVDYRGNETMPHLFYFDMGDPKLNILIVERLSRLCGPLFIFPDTGARPLLVTPGIDPMDVIKVWNIP